MYQFAFVLSVCAFLIMIGVFMLGGMDKVEALRVNAYNQNSTATVIFNNRLR